MSIDYFNFNRNFVRFWQGVVIGLLLAILVWAGIIYGVYLAAAPPIADHAIANIFLI